MMQPHLLQFMARAAFHISGFCVAAKNEHGLIFSERMHYSMFY